ncbi:MAG: NAD(P)H-dependent oxidoreductase subunit E, partial [Candidatus Eremiobacteraeota bacterium]|nr:NAD(P)H-dependent oxidoreductase subunit E [Candidatus Eremiobacteraeota bacterium]
MPDLHFTSATASPEERSAVDAVAARAERHLLLPTLHALNDRVGWLSEGALNYVCERLNVPPAEAYGVATFYAMFSTKPRPPQLVHACDDIGCRNAGAEQLIGALETSGAHVLRSPCLGLCNRAPAVLTTNAGPEPGAMQIAPASPDAVRRQHPSG